MTDKRGLYLSGMGFSRVGSLMISPYVTLALTMAWFIALYVGAIGGFVFLFGALLFFVIQFVYILSVAIDPRLGKKNRSENSLWNFGGVFDTNLSVSEFKSD